MNALQYQQSPPTALATRHGWLVRLVVTIGLNLVSLKFFPALCSDIATAGQLLSCVVPAVWGIYAFFAYQTRKERIVGYVSILPAFFWIFCAGSLAWQNGWSWRW